MQDKTAADFMVMRLILMGGTPEVAFSWLEWLS